MLCLQTMVDTDLPIFEIGENTMTSRKHFKGELVFNDLFGMISPDEIVGSFFCN